MKYADNIRALDQLKPDMTGFIFHPSSPRFADAVPEYMPTSSLRVGVFVNSDTNYILYKVKEFGINIVQLHGNESPEQCRAIRSKGIEIIKAFSLKTGTTGCADTISSIPPVLPTADRARLSTGRSHRAITERHHSY